ncbi:hypothetical protein ACIRP0_33390 [Streptomyces sp. NPDC101733]|uniref:cold shock domain-containing protein n=1 Tax=unclassified Streptomyces TaxID=2593676 RepID=UPI00341C8D48
MRERNIGFVQWYSREEGRGALVMAGQSDHIRFDREDLSGECHGLSVEQQVSFVLDFGPVGFSARDIRP